MTIAMYHHNNLHEEKNVCFADFPKAKKMYAQISNANWLPAKCHKN